jgi:hypothetical protein
LEFKGSVQSGKDRIRDFGFHSSKNSFFDSKDEEKPAKKRGGFIDFGDWGW